MTSLPHDAPVEAPAKRGIARQSRRIHKTLGEGNFVPTVSEGQFAGRESVFYGLFRVESGTIAEHWDTIESIPERRDWKNSNGKF
jgi:predicted SnoaL-like aldol condensation-catalyzing enzyme